MLWPVEEPLLVLKELFNIFVKKAHKGVDIFQHSTPKDQEQVHLVSWRTFHALGGFQEPFL